MVQRLALSVLMATISARSRSDHSTTEKVCKSIPLVTTIIFRSDARVCLRSCSSHQRAGAVSRFLCQEYPILSYSVNLTYRLVSSSLIGGGFQTSTILPCGWCPSIAWMQGRQSVVDCLLSRAGRKVRGHTIAQPLLHSPYMVRQTCRHSRRDWLPLLGGAGAPGQLRCR